MDRDGAGSRLFEHDIHRNVAVRHDKRFSVVDDFQCFAALGRSDVDRFHIVVFIGRCCYLNKLAGIRDISADFYGTVNGSVVGIVNNAPAHLIPYRIGVCLAQEENGSG